jgi:hypothetical protein
MLISCWPRPHSPLENSMGSPAASIPSLIRRISHSSFTLAVNLRSFTECVEVYETLRQVPGVELLGEPGACVLGRRV